MDESLSVEEMGPGLTDLFTDRLLCNEIIPVTERQLPGDTIPVIEAALIDRGVRLSSDEQSSDERFNIDFLGVDIPGPSEFDSESRLETACPSVSIRTTIKSRNCAAKRLKHTLDRAWCLVGTVFPLH